MNEKGVRDRMLVKEVLTFIILSVLTIIPICAFTPRKSLTIQERLEYQEKIEAVRSSLRKAPETNRADSRGNLETIPQKILTERAEDALRKSSAYEALYHRAITPVMLQDELNRMGISSRRPEMLKKIFHALGDNPYTVVEMLARPARADRLLRTAYAEDESLHSESRKKAEAALEEQRSSGEWPSNKGFYSRELVVRKLGEGERINPLRSYRDERVRRLNEDEWKRFREDWPKPGSPVVMKETRTGFVLLKTSQKGDGILEAESLYFPKKSFDAWWKGVRNKFSCTEPSDEASFDFKLPLFSTTAPCGTFQPMPGSPSPTDSPVSVWTGNEMIFWMARGWWYDSDGTGGRYDPATDTWWPLPAPPFPLSQMSDKPVVVWTGKRMLLFFGSYWGDLLVTVWSYNPASDAWTQVGQGSGCPEGARSLSGVWTGSEVLLWGEAYPGGGESIYSKGARYNPESDTWSTMSTVNQPSPRSKNCAVWTGTEMIIWGGSGEYVDYNDGSCYDPSSDIWHPISIASSVPEARHDFSAVWDGADMIVWGGENRNWQYLGDGARYDPVADTWTPVSQTNAPDKRASGTAVWSGSRMIIWGGVNRGPTGLDNETALNTGGIYDPGTDSWLPTSTGTDCPPPRLQHTAVWTGSEMLIWGGLSYGEDGYFNRHNDGARYSPDSDTWITMSMGDCNLDRRAYESVVSTGAEFIVWGGEDTYYNFSNTGAKLDMITGIWQPIADDQNTPSARYFHTAIWTGTEMVIWGGDEILPFPYDPAPTSTGACYNPATDSWRVTTTEGECPSPRDFHTAIWDGNEMIVWGGEDSDSEPLQTGARYNPTTNIWTVISSGANSPRARWRHSAVWTGDSMIVWGGTRDVNEQPDDLFADGGIYYPDMDLWLAIPEKSGSPEARVGDTAVWTGDSMIIWGGDTGRDIINLGAKFYPATQIWTPISSGENCPAPKRESVGIWTGAHMLIYGGWDYDWSSTAAGGIYNPRLDSWQTIDTTGQNVPGCSAGKGVWNGHEFIMFSGSAWAVWKYDLCLGGRLRLTHQPQESPYTVSLSAELDGGTAPFTYHWDFGDGNQMDGGPNATHVYSAIGTYNITLTVNDSTSNTNSIERNLALTPLPFITKVKKVKRRPWIKLKGGNFEENCTVSISGHIYAATKRKSSDKVLLKNRSYIKALFPKGVPVTIRVTNPDGGWVETQYAR